jgi:hypothetical protein
MANRHRSNRQTFTETTDSVPGTVTSAVYGRRHLAPLIGADDEGRAVSLPLSHVASRLGKGFVASLVALLICASGLVAARAGASPIEDPPGQGTSLQTIFSGAALGLSQPDDLTMMDGQVFVAFQNGLGPEGQPSSTGGLDSTVVEMSTTGTVEASWQLAGHCDGLTADPAAHELIATVNEDLNSSLFTIDPSSPTPTQYSYSPSPLPHNGGTDAVSVIGGQILVSASAPGTRPLSASAPQPTYPAVYSVTLEPTTPPVAAVTPLFYDEASAMVANAGPTEGRPTTLALTDPDSNEVVPPESPRFGGDFVLDSQGDQQQIYLDDPGQAGQSLSVLNLSQSIDDSAWATSGDGTLYITDNADNLVEALRGHFDAGTVFVSVTPCGANSAPSTCPAPGFAANYLGTLDLSTGVVSAVDLGSQSVQPVGLHFEQGNGGLGNRS